VRGADQSQVPKAKNVKRGFIGWFSALPGENPAVRAMFERAETWLKDRGLDHIVAPFNGAAILGVGVRSAAYDEDPIFPFLWQPMKPVLDPHQMLIGEVNGQTAGFCLGMPDWTPLFRSFKGKVGLPQVIRLMLTAGRYQRAGLLAIGALPAYRGIGTCPCPRGGALPEIRGSRLQGSVLLSGE